MATTKRCIDRGMTVGVLLALLAGQDALAQVPAKPSPVENVFVVTLDGFRWQEMFGGLDAANNNKADGGVVNPAGLVERFGRPTPQARREALLPFLWSVVAREGQILGDPGKGSLVRITNGLWFSYPGYNEMLSGAPDPRIDSNDKNVNPNLTVLEWLNRQPGFEGRVAAFGSWDVLPFIVAADRSRLHVNGDGPAVKEPSTDRAWTRRPWKERSSTCARESRECSTSCSARPTSGPTSGATTSTSTRRGAGTGSSGASGMPRRPTPTTAERRRS